MRFVRPRAAEGREVSGRKLQFFKDLRSFRALCPRPTTPFSPYQHFRINLFFLRTADFAAFILVNGPRPDDFPPRTG